MTRVITSLGALVLVLAACGGSAADADTQIATLEDTDTTAGEADSGDVDAEAALFAFTECMREQGIEFSDPTVDADGNVQLGQPQNFDAQEDGRAGIRAAAQECEENLEGLTLGFGRPDQTELEDTLLEFAACMRDNGYDMPDPDFSNFGPGAGGEDGDNGGEGAQGGGGGPFGDLDFDDPAFQTAQDACEDLLDGLPRGGGGQGGQGGGQGGQGGGQNG